MKTELRTYTVKEMCEGFVYNELEGKGLYGLNGQLTTIDNCQLLCKTHNKVKGNR